MVSVPLAIVLFVIGMQVGTWAGLLVAGLCAARRYAEMQDEIERLRCQLNLS